MKNFTVFLIVVIATILSFNSCDTSSTDTDPPKVMKLDSLKGTVWIWEKYKDENGKIIFVKDSNQRPFVLNFFSDSSMKGLAGCNEFGSEYVITNHSIIFGRGYTTLLLCNEI